MGRLSNDLAESRDELLAVKEANTEELEQMRSKMEEQVSTLTKYGAQMDYEKAEMLERMRFVEEELQQANDAFEAERMGLRTQMEMLNERASHGESRYRQVGINLFVERLRRMFEVRIKEKTT